VDLQDLESAFTQNWQPFDAPNDAALATYLHADKTNIAGRTRLTFQIGIKATERDGGHRPAMNVGVVLDLRNPVSGADAVRVRALLDAINRARQPGDQFSLTVAGPQGGTLIEPADFRHSRLRVTTAQLIAGEPINGATAQSLAAAVSNANDSAGKDDDPSAALGSSLVFLIATSDVTAEFAQLKTLAHAGAVAGVTLSVAPLNLQVSLPAIDRLVLLGQGSRLALTNADDANVLIDREFHFASRAVARAL
jgi:hypothetical protein